MELFRCYNCMKAFDRSSSSVCPNCHFDQNTPPKEDHYLAPGTVLEGQYIIGKTIGAGGFGITYVAWDDHLKRKVAIKEYFPLNIASRLPGTNEVTVNSGDDSEQYEYWLRAFIDEALRLAAMDSLNGIVHIFNSFVANCTAYIVMEFLDGNTLKDILQERNSPLKYDEVVEMVVPALYSLDAIHQENIIHRDIAPDNIMRLHDGKIKIFDFGSAKNSTVSVENLAVLVKPGYSAIEQYDLDGQQGPYTDIYSMAAVMYHMITGKRPPDSPDRQKNNQPLPTPSELGISIPQSIENIIMYALNVEPEYRIQSAREFADELSSALLTQRQIEQEERNKAGKWTKKMKIGVGIAAALVAVIISGIFAFTMSPKNEASQTAVVIIDFSTKTLEEVEAWAKASNVKLINKGEMKTADKNKEGLVIYQSKRPNETISKNDLDSVELIIRVGKYDKNADANKNKKVKMPDLLGKTEDEALKALTDLGFTAESIILADAQYSEKYAENTVCKQSVAKGKSVALSSKITLTLSKGIEVTTTEETTTAYEDTEDTVDVAVDTEEPPEVEYAPTTTTQAPVTQPPATDPPPEEDPGFVPGNEDNGDLGGDLGGDQGDGPNFQADDGGYVEENPGFEADDGGYVEETPGFEADGGADFQADGGVDFQAGGDAEESPVFSVN